MRYCLLKFSLFFVVTFFSSLQLKEANAQINIGERAIIAAKNLEIASQTSFKNNTLNQLDNEVLTNEQHLQIKILNGFDGSGEANFLDDIKAYKEIAIKNAQTPNIEHANFYLSLATLYNPYHPELKNNMDLAFKYLESQIDNNNWQISHNSLVLISVFQSSKRNFPIALKNASRSLSVIPEEDSLNSQIARYYSYGMTTYLHGILRNAELYIPSLDALVAYSQKIGAPIESVNFLNNLIYSLKDFDLDAKVVRELTNILLRTAEIYPSETSGLVEMRAATALATTGDFEQVLELTIHGQEVATNPLILTRLKIVEIQALAALEQPTLARNKLDELKIWANSNNKDLTDSEADIFKAKALIAMSESRSLETYEYMKRFAELSTQRILKSNNTDTSNLLANLENDKARQAEREAAREEMFKLEQEALQSRIAAGQRGLFIVLLLAMAALMTATFMAYRSRTATKLAVAAEAALAGEKAKTQFLAVISHELRTPLNGIIGIADLLSRTAPTESLRQKINIINNSGLDLLKLVEQILDMSRIDANELEIFPENADIRELFEGIDLLWRPTIETKDVKFTSHVDSSVPEFLLIDPLRLRQCVNNLVSNASKFTSQGRIHMHVFSEDAPADNSALLKIIVADTGMGIRQEVQDNLFRPFVQADSSITRQYGGSGLGLAITRSLARMMGGDLTVMSREGAGSEFTLTFTAKYIADTQLLDTMDELFSEIEADDEAQSKQAQLLLDQDVIAVTAPEKIGGVDSEFTDIEVAMEDKPDTRDQETSIPNFDDLKGTRILVVEDIQSNQDVMKIFLEPEGCEVLCADNGIHALKALRTQDFDVVLMDIRMPEMDGIEATRLIRSEDSRNKYVPIIALTADATAETNAQCMAAGANIFLTKPIIATELFDSIRFVRRQAYNRLEADQETQLEADQETQLEAKPLSKISA